MLMDHKHCGSGKRHVRGKTGGEGIQWKTKGAWRDNAFLYCV